MSPELASFHPWFLGNWESGSRRYFQVFPVFFSQNSRWFFRGKHKLVLVHPCLPSLLVVQYSVVVVMELTLTTRSLLSQMRSQKHHLMHHRLTSYRIVFQHSTVKLKCFGSRCCYCCFRLNIYFIIVRHLSFLLPASHHTSHTGNSLARLKKNNTTAHVQPMRKSDVVFFPIRVIGNKPSIVLQSRKKISDL